MTSLVYRDNVLAADSLMIINSGETMIPTIAQKVHVSKNKQFAYGLCGYNTTENCWKLFEDWVEEAIIKFHSSGTVRAFIKDGSDFHVIIMSRRMTYKLSFKNNIVSVFAIDEGDYVIHGTGMVVGLGYLTTTNMSAVEVVNKAIQYDTLSGGDIHAIKRSVLKPCKDY